MHSLQARSSLQSQGALVKAFCSVLGKDKEASPRQQGKAAALESGVVTAVLAGVDNNLCFIKVGKLP